ncbi:MAG: YqgE/AlgH family protein [Nocardioidaceae bacterium]
MTLASLGGRLLVATPLLEDPNFHRTVVLILDHDDDGALGVVLNRPSEIPVVAVLPDWTPAVPEPSQLFTGGPVSPQAAVAVGVRSDRTELAGFRHTTGDFGLVDLDADPEQLAPALVGIRVFAGYSGWGSDQLETEIAEGSWYVVSAEPRDVLHPEPESLWRSVLRRQPGELAYVATFPSDPVLN